MTPEQSEQQRRKIQEQLDQALEDSFPASDPVSIVTSQDEEDWHDDSRPAGSPQSPETSAGR
jgi:2-methylcitrate dehydratase PrpD